MFIYFATFLATLLLGSSCAKLAFRSQGKIPVSLSKQEGHRKTVSVIGQRDFFLWGLVPGEQTVYVDQELANQGLISASQVQSTYGQSGSQKFWSILTLGLYMPWGYQLKAQGAVHE